MTNEELNLIAEEIHSSKVPRKMTKRDFVNALGCEKRTSGNVAYINNWLDKKQLITVPDYVNGWIDEPMELQFKYTIRHTHFQLYSLWISSYRNLKNFSIDFEQTDQYCTLIGLNGSGKSNVLEAISEIFLNLYRGSVPRFQYTLKYVMDGNFFEIRNGKINGNAVTEAQLPRNVVASYSGEDNRMWKSHYWPLYQDYCQHIADMPSITVPKMMAIGRKQWNIAFATLLYARSSNSHVRDFLESIIATSGCRIRLKFNLDNLKTWKETIGKQFVNILTNKDEYTIDEFVSVVDDMGFVDSPSTLFNLLYQATAERGSNPICDVDIRIDDHGSLNALSEGEKKMIVVITIMEILSTERSLCLFDEPDSHVHVSRKMEMLELIDTDNRYSVLTTHSPMFIDEKKEDNIRYMNNGNVESVDRLRLVKQLSGGTISLIDAAYIIGWKKKVLLVEGAYDKKYLEKAINVLSTENPQFLKIKLNVTIISVGGTGDTKAKYDELVKGIIDELDKVVFLFDYDTAGLTGWKKVNEIITADPSLVSKVIPLFYQEGYGVQKSTGKNFDLAYPSNIQSINDVNSFMVEDLFDKNDYKSEIQLVTNSQTHKDFRCIKKPTAQKIKEYIQNKYSTFTDYSRFKPILEKLLNVFELI